MRPILFEIPLFALIVIAAAASLVAAVGEPRRARLATVALSHALALLTYYLAPFVVAAHAPIVVAAWRRRRCLRRRCPCRHAPDRAGSRRCSGTGARDVAGVSGPA
jgi:hypothetical protein